LLPVDFASEKPTRCFKHYSGVFPFHIRVKITVIIYAALITRVLDVCRATENRWKRCTLTPQMCRIEGWDVKSLCVRGNAP
jgi:hypothetical protein